MIAITVLALASTGAGESTAAPAARWFEVSDGAWRVPQSVVTAIRAQIQQAADGAVAASVTQEKRSVLNDTVQYQGLIDQRDKRELVQLFGMCETDASPAKLRDFWRVVHDGGNCYYWAEYDMTLNRFVSFRFNSAA